MLESEYFYISYTVPISTYPSFARISTNFLIVLVEIFLVHYLAYIYMYLGR